MRRLLSLHDEVSRSSATPRLTGTRLESQPQPPLFVLWMLLCRQQPGSRHSGTQNRPARGGGFPIRERKEGFVQDPSLQKSCSTQTMVTLGRAFSEEQRFARQRALRPGYNEHISSALDPSSETLSRPRAPLRRIRSLPEFCCIMLVCESRRGLATLQAEAICRLCCRP